MGEVNVQAYQCVILAGKINRKYLLNGYYLNKYGVFYFVTGSNLSESRDVAFKKKWGLEFRFRCRLGDPEVVPPSGSRLDDKPAPKLPTSSKFPELWA